MSKERRYDEKEIAAIFERATKAQKEAQSHLGQGEGLTLAELQEIGAEAGLTPEFIAQAASAIDHTVTPGPRVAYLGVPVGVSRTAALPGPLSDEAWEHLVVDLRETFSAQGKVERHGSLRQWTNGNLKALIEPTATGHRLRLTTDSAKVRGRLMAGGMVFIMGLCLLAVTLSKSPVQIGELMMMIMMALAGAGVAGSGALIAPRWARTRERQMEDVIERVTRMTAPASIAEPEQRGSLALEARPDQKEAPMAVSPRTVRDRG